MKGMGPRNERETIINFNDVDETATVWTASEVVYRRLKKRLGWEHLIEDGERHAIFAFPRKLLNLPMVRTKRVMSEAHKAKLLGSRRKSTHTETQNGQSTPISQGGGK